MWRPVFAAGWAIRWAIGTGSYYCIEALGGNPPAFSFPAAFVPMSLGVVKHKSAQSVWLIVQVCPITTFKPLHEVSEPKGSAMLSRPNSAGELPLTWEGSSTIGLGERGGTESGVRP